MRASAFRTLQKAGSMAAGATRVAVAKGKTMARTSSSSLAAATVRKDTFPDAPVDVNPSTGVPYLERYAGDDIPVVVAQACEGAASCWG